MKQRKSLIVLLTLAALVLGTILTAGSAAAATILKAQTGDQDWAAPVNLSRSGASTNPRMVIDSNGRYHVLWEDEIDGFVYAGSGVDPATDGWSAPRPVEMPFYTRRIFPDLRAESATPRFTPTLVADLSGFIHAFWVNDQSDPDGALIHSAVPAGSFSQYDAWSTPETLQTGVGKPAAVADGFGVHLVYVRTRETADRQAGIYYQRLPVGGGWMSPRVLYTSRYLRSRAATAGGVDIASLDDGQLVAAWDDVGREMVFAAQSADGGSTWAAPVEIDRRSIEDASSAIGPGGVAIGGFGSQAILTWHAGHQSAGVCTQQYRSLTTDSSAWSLSQILPGLNDCLTSAQFIDDGSMLYLFGVIEQSGMNSTVLLAWDGTRWSDPQVQASLKSLSNPDTNQPISLSCLHAAGHLDRLSLVGCDSGVGGDIWWTTRSLGDAAAWFSPPSKWQGPITVATTQLPAASVRLITDGTGVSHAFWFEPGNAQIFHAHWDGAAWSSAAAIVNTGDKNIDGLAVAGDGARLYLIYSNSQGLYFAQAGVERPLEWSSPVPLPADLSDVTDPSIALSQTGDILVSYAVALNEPRGVYLLRSLDSGASWSEPSRLFSGADAGWEAVGHSRLIETADGRLHALWSRYSLPPESKRLGAAYSWSDDGGATWSPPAMVVRTSANGGDIGWVSLEAYGERSLHILFSENANARQVLWDLYSVDGGLSWAERVQIGSLDPNDDPASSLDPTGQLHLAGMEDGNLVTWTFDGAKWRADEKFLANLADGGELAVTVDRTGRLIAVYGVASSNLSVGTATGALYAMSRPLDLPAEALPTPPPPPPTATPEPTAAPTSTPEPTPTLVLPTAPDGGSLSAVPGAGSQAGQLALAVIPAILVILLVVVLGFRAMRRGGR